MFRGMCQTARHLWIVSLWQRHVCELVDFKAMGLCRAYRRSNGVCRCCIRFFPPRIHVTRLYRESILFKQSISIRCIVYLRDRKHQCLDIKCYLQWSPPISVRTFLLYFREALSIDTTGQAPDSTVASETRLRIIKPTTATYKIVLGAYGPYYGCLPTHTLKSWLKLTNTTYLPLAVGIVQCKGSLFWGLYLQHS